MSKRQLYFSSGPTMIVPEVMKQVHDELLNYRNMGISVMEMRARTKEFGLIIDEAESDLRKLMDIPDNYSVLFMHGGARTQFDSIPMNLCPENSSAEYIVTGTWSMTAANEAEKHACVQRQVLLQDSATRVPNFEELKSKNSVAYRYYCDNETAQGLEFNYIPVDGQVPLVCDMSSNFLSRPIDVIKYGLIFAGAQKNCGIAGLGIVVVRNDLIGKQRSHTPTLQNYKVIAESKSLHNAPPTFAIYVAGLCFKWLLRNGGLEAMDKISKEKSDLVYDTIDNSNGFYTCPVSCESRSRMNVVFSIANNKQLETEFITEAANEGLYELKGHMSVGGLRISLYHGIGLDDVKRLVKFMEAFRAKNAA